MNTRNPIPATNPGYSINFLNRLINICKTVPLIVVSILVTRLFSLDFSIATSYDRNFHDKLVYFPTGGKPIIADCDTVYPHIPLELHIIFTMYSRTIAGNANLKFSYKILKPGGGTWFDTTGIEAFTGLTGEKKGLIASRASPLIRFSKNDKQGIYKLIVSAEDLVNMTTATREKPIVLSALPRPAASTFDIISFNIWVHSYCNSPDPSRATAAFSYFITSDASNDDAIFWPVFYFFQCLFAENPYLVSELIVSFSANSVRLKEYTVLLLMSIDYKPDKNNKVIPDSLWKKFDKAAENRFVEPFTLACMSGSPQVIESGFYYYGKYSMVRFLVECLGLSTPSGYETFRSHAHRYDQSCMQFVDRESAAKMSDNAKKILAKAYSKHSLISTFCDFALEYDDIGTDSKKILGDIIGQKRPLSPDYHRDSSP